MNLKNWRITATGKDWGTRRKICPSANCLPQISQGLALRWNRASLERGRQLTASSHGTPLKCELNFWLHFRIQFLHHPEVSVSIIRNDRGYSSLYSDGVRAGPSGVQISAEARDFSLPQNALNLATHFSPESGLSSWDAITVLPSYAVMAWKGTPLIG